MRASAPPSLTAAAARTRRAGSAALHGIQCEYSEYPAGSSGPQCAVRVLRAPTRAASAALQGDARRGGGARAASSARVGKTRQSRGRKRAGGFARGVLRTARCTMRVACCVLRVARTPQWPEDSKACVAVLECCVDLKAAPHHLDGPVRKNRCDPTPSRNTMACRLPRVRLIAPRGIMCLA